MTKWFSGSEAQSAECKAQKKLVVASWQSPVGSNQSPVTSCQSPVGSRTPCCTISNRVSILPFFHHSILPLSNYRIFPFFHHSILPLSNCRIVEFPHLPTYSLRLMPYAYFFSPKFKPALNYPKSFINDCK